MIVMIVVIVGYCNNCDHARYVVRDIALIWMVLCMYGGG